MQCQRCVSGACSRDFIAVGPVDIGVDDAVELALDFFMLGFEPCKYLLLLADRIDVLDFLIAFDGLTRLVQVLVEVVTLFVECRI